MSVDVKCRTCGKDVMFRSMPKRMPKRFKCNWCREQGRIARRDARLQRRRKRRAAMREAPYPKPDWNCDKKPWCECCGKAYIKKTFMLAGVPQPKRVEHSHHIIPRRLAAQFGYPDHFGNLASCCSECHGRLKRLDERILSNDWVGAVAVARELHFPLDRLVAAAESYGFTQVRRIAA